MHLLNGSLIISEECDEANKHASASKLSILSINLLFNYPLPALIRVAIGLFLVDTTSDGS